MRKFILSMGATDIKEYPLTRDDFGNPYPKKDRGYHVSFKFNGCDASCADDNRYETWKSAILAMQLFIADIFNKNFNMKCYKEHGPVHMEGYD